VSRRRQARTVKVVQPPTLPGDVRWAPPYSYDCSAGHHVQAERPLPSCPAYTLSQPCPGQLNRVGRGSRS